jgi:hypothetical protein
LPATDNPLAKALTDAGITVTYVAASKDPDGKGIVGPGLAVTVARRVEGVGTGPSSVTYTFGRSYARATGEGPTGDAAPTAPDAAATPTDTGSAPLPASTAGAPTAGPSAPSAGPAATDAPSSPQEPTASAPVASSSPGATGSQDVVAARTRLANASAASIYPVLVFGAVLLAASFALFKMLGVKLRWS